jgi:hypothetical protein
MDGSSLRLWRWRLGILILAGALIHAAARESLMQLPNQATRRSGLIHRQLSEPRFQFLPAAFAGFVRAFSGRL